ncbi:hypothetical protein BMS3Bbin16_00247 [archaeon BMS3Bbin16]|nr:hypothetical protein BMS3Bbin16_00247 [archaeon BMS3Bbin16]
MLSGGRRDYNRREYCNAVNCKVQLLLNEEDPGSEVYEKIRGICRENCIHTTYEFHHWLVEQGFSITKPED